MLLTKWEYKIIDTSNARSDTILNELGEEGWELVSVMYSRAYLKRSKGTYREIGK